MTIVCGATHQDLLDLLEELHGCLPVHLVVASRIKPNSETSSLELDPLPDDSAQQLLIAHNGRAAPNWQPGQAAHLSAACCNNALLLKIIGAMLAGRRCTIEVRCLQLPCLLCKQAAWRRASNPGP